MVQRRAARWTLHNYSPYTSVTEMLQSLGWRSLKQRRSYSRYVCFTRSSTVLQLFTCHPTLCTLWEPSKAHTQCPSVKYILQWTTTNTLSTPSQSCNGTGCRQVLHCCPHLILSRGQCAQSAIHCLKWEHMGFFLFLTYPLLTSHRRAPARNPREGGDAG